MKKLFITILALSFLFGSIKPVYALNTSDTSGADFGSCVNPRWALSQENKGDNHGVVNVDSFAGTDKIYKSNSNALQCLCTDSGNGYETKWLDTSDLTESQINDYKKDGWILVENGASWGLKNSPYLAKNSDYSCKSSGGVGGASTSNTAGASTTTSDDPYKGVLGLASTGNSMFLYLLFLIGSISLITGLLTNRVRIKNG